MQNILLVGAGKMGFSMLRGWLQAMDESYRFIVVDPVAEPRLSALEPADFARIAAMSDLDDLSPETHPVAVVFATKPDGVCDAVSRVCKCVSPDTVLISVAAGLKINRIRQSAASGNSIVRVMPNIGALIGRSASAGVSSENTTASQRRLIEHLFEALGSFTWLDSEDDMHAVTAVSGSGPAYFFALCEAMIGAAVESGLERGVAETLVHATCSAAGGLIERTPNATSLRQQVTSPNGTTAAGLAALAWNDGLQTVVTSAVDAARKRSIEMA